jgi:hypothetical protein
MNARLLTPLRVKLFDSAGANKGRREKCYLAC